MTDYSQIKNRKNLTQIRNAFEKFQNSILILSNYTICTVHNQKQLGEGEAKPKHYS